MRLPSFLWPLVRSLEFRLNHPAWHRYSPAVMRHAGCLGWSGNAPLSERVCDLADRLTDGWCHD